MGQSRLQRDADIAAEDALLDLLCTKLYVAVVCGDIGGVVVIPRKRLAATVEAALAKVEGENASRTMLEEGHLLRDVYDRFGVL